MERGEDTGAPFPVQISWLAEKFITYYWRQTKPYVSPLASAEPALLRQNTGQQAAVLSALKQLTAVGVSFSVPPTYLDQFLFGSERAPLEVYQPILREVQEGRCFYCRREVASSDDKAHIDHFTPWAQYPVDLGHNFVLTHGTCNLAKSDHLAAVASVFLSSQ